MLQPPFEARGIQDFPVHQVEVDEEYTVVEISPDGSRFGVEFPDGTLGWFPAKYVRILETPQRQPQQKTAMKTNTANTYNTNTAASYNTNTAASYNTNTADDQRRRDYEEVKKQNAEKEKRRQELQKKLKQQPAAGRKVDNEVDPDEVDQAYRQLHQLKTYTEARGYLSNAAGFNKDLTKYVDDDEDNYEPEPEPVKETKTQNNTSGMYRKVEERQDGPKYVPSDDIPAQYKYTPWKCHSCHSTHPADRMKCNMYGTQRGELSISMEDQATGPGTEWPCPSCKVTNSPNRMTCIMCGSKWRPTASPAAKSRQPEKAVEKKSQVGTVKKKAIVTKAGSGVELQYAKGVDNHKNGGYVPGHGAGY